MKGKGQKQTRGQNLEKQEGRCRVHNVERQKMESVETLSDYGRNTQK